MSDETLPPVSPEDEITPDSPTESFSDMLAEFEHSHTHKAEGAANQMQGTVVSLDAESVYLDIGFKTEGVLLRTAFPNNADAITPGQTFSVSLKGRNPEGYYELSILRVAQPKDWTSLQESFTNQTAIAGTVTAVVKGGFSVDVGVRAFMPSSRSGVRDAADMEKLVGQEISCRIIKLDIEEEDVVVDRRVITEEQAGALLETRLHELTAGAIVSGQVRSLTTYGAFVDIGGIDGLLHITDIAWHRVNAPEDVLSVGQQLELKILTIDPDTKRISLGLKQLQPEPWDSVADTIQAGQRITGTISRLTDFGAFVELQPGIEGLIHVSEMSWVKKVRKPSDMLKQGETVDVMVLSVNPAERRISLGLKQALGDPWAEVPTKFPVGSAIEGPVTQLMKFGAFVQIAEGIEGLVHVSEITADRHIHHPQDVLHVGQIVKAQVVAIDAEKRQIRLSMKQLIPTGLAEYLVEHKPGDIVTGRVVEQSAGSSVIELGEGIRATCKTPTAAPTAATSTTPTLDLSSLTSMLNARWKGGASPVAQPPEALSVGQVRSFRLLKVDCDHQTIELELA
jgi:small subunit ribosomal protein S1